MKNHDIKKKFWYPIVGSKVMVCKVVFFACAWSCIGKNLQSLGLPCLFFLYTVNCNMMLHTPYLYGVAPLINVMPNPLPRPQVC